MQNENKSKGIFHENRNDKKKEVAILISDKINLKTNSHRERQRGALYNDKVTNMRILLIIIYELNMIVSKCIKQILTDMKGETDNTTVTVGELNNPVTSMDRQVIQVENQ